MCPLLTFCRLFNLYTYVSPRCSVVGRCDRMRARTLPGERAAQRCNIFRRGARRANASAVRRALRTHGTHGATRTSTPAYIPPSTPQRLHGCAAAVRCLLPHNSAALPRYLPAVLTCTAASTPAYAPALPYAPLPYLPQHLQPASMASSDKWTAALFRAFLFMRLVRDVYVYRLRRAIADSSVCFRTFTGKSWITFDHAANAALARTR